MAHLIAAGRTNQQAAAELFVSQKTVEYHLARIYPSWGLPPAASWPPPFAPGTLALTTRVVP